MQQSDSSQSVSLSAIQVGAGVGLDVVGATLGREEDGDTEGVAVVGALEEGDNVGLALGDVVGENVVGENVGADEAGETVGETLG